MRRREQREQTRERLYRAALEVFRRDGVGPARVEHITDAAGVSRASFYFHFSTKDQVLLARVLESERRIAARLAALPPSTTLRPLLRAFGRAFAREWQDEPRLFADAALVALRQATSGVPAESAQPVRAGLAARFHHAAERGELSAAVPPELLSDFFLVNSLGAALAWTGQRAQPLEIVLDNVATLFLEGARRRKK